MTRKLSITAAEPRKLCFHYTHLEKEPVKGIHIDHNRKNPAGSSWRIQPAPINDSFIPIPREKYDDLQELAKDLFHQENREFYANLPKLPHRKRKQPNSLPALELEDDDNFLMLEFDHYGSSDYQEQLKTPVK